MLARTLGAQSTKNKIANLYDVYSLHPPQYHALKCRTYKNYCARSAYSLYCPIESYMQLWPPGVALKHRLDAIQSRIDASHIRSPHSLRSEPQQKPRHPSPHPPPRVRLPLAVTKRSGDSLGSQALLKLPAKRPHPAP